MIKKGDESMLIPLQIAEKMSSTKAKAKANFNLITKALKDKN